MRFSTFFAAALSASTVMASPMFNSTATSAPASLTTASVMKRDLHLKNLTASLVSRVRSSVHLNSTLIRRNDTMAPLIKARSIQIPTLRSRAHNSTAFAKRGKWSNDSATAVPAPIARRSVMANFSTALNSTRVVKRGVALNSTLPTNGTLIARGVHLNSTIALKNSTVVSKFTSLKNKFFHKRSVRLQEAINWNSTHNTQF